MGEREQKRLYHAPLADSIAGQPYPWVYYLLGGSKDQLAVWDGQQMTSPFCDTVRRRNVFLYPTEYLTYGVGKQSSVLTRPDGSKEYRFFDHLGSSRAVLSSSGFTFSDYAPFGGLLGGGTESRKGFIDKEKDGESSLRNFGLRQYDEGSGRFLRIDPLWEKFPGETPYNYAENNPVVLKDPNGDCPWCWVPFVIGLWIQETQIAQAPTKNPEADRIATESVKRDLEIIQSIPSPRGAVKAIQSGVKAAIGGAAKGGESVGKAAAKSADNVKIRNQHLSGNTHPKTGVSFNKDGFPDFSGHLYKAGKNDVHITPTGNNGKDFAAANKAAGYTETPAGYTWHHHQETGRMQLVESQIHRNTGHTGGAALWPTPTK